MKTRLPSLAKTAFQLATVTLALPLLPLLAIAHLAKLLTPAEESPPVAVPAPSPALRAPWSEKSDVSIFHTAA